MTTVDLPNNCQNSINQYGLTEVHATAGGELADVIFIHGMNGHPHRSWTSEKNGVFWPAELLPPVLQDRARILVYGYDGDIASFTDSISRDRIHNHAEQLIATLCTDRHKHKAAERPIIFIAHSIGGLILKRALIYSSGILGHKTEHLRSIFVSTYGILFLGTPHKGSDLLAWGSQIKGIHSATAAQPQLVNSMSVNSETLQNIDRDFIQLASRFRLYFFHEGKRTIVEENLQYIVDETSASPTIPDVERAVIQQDHSHICQFDDDRTPGFDLVTGAIQRYATEAEDVIAGRWQTERAEQILRKQAWAEELLPGLTSGSVQLSLENSVGPVEGQILATVKAHSARQEHYCVVPRERVKDFIGRETELRHISSHFSYNEGRQPQVLILHALGGQGKSQIALEYCQVSRERYCGIFWVNASSEALAIQSYNRIAAELSIGSPTDSGDGSRIVKVVKDFLERWNHSWLLIFDNYDKPDEFSNVQRFLPKSKHGHVILTSRNRDLDRLGSLMEIPAMSIQEGIRLLLGGHSDQVVKEHFKVAASIIKRLGGLALAIDQAAAYIRYKRIPLHQLGEFLTTYEIEKEKILSYTPRNFWEYGTVQIHGDEGRSKAMSAFTTWEMSFEQLRNDGVIARDAITHFLTLSAFFNPARIEESLFHNYWEDEMYQARSAQWLRFLSTTDKSSEEENVEDNSSVGDLADENNSDDNYDTRRKHGVGSLGINSSSVGSECRWDSEQYWTMIRRSHELSLLQNIERDAEGAIFSLHPLIRDWLQLREKANKHQKYIDESLKVVASSAVLFTIDHTSLKQRAALLAHIDICMSDEAQRSKPQYSTDGEVEFSETLGRLAAFYATQGRYEASRKLSAIFYDSRRRVLGETHSRAPTDKFRLAYSLCLQGQYDEAELLFRQILEIQETILPKDNPVRLRTVSEWAGVLSLKGKYHQAEQMYRSILEPWKTALGKEDHFTLHAMQGLAVALQYQKKYKEAEQLHRQTLAISQLARAKNDPSTLRSMSGLAGVLGDQGQYEEAERMYRQLLESLRALHGKQHPGTLRTMSNLARMLWEQGKYDEAQPMFRQALGSFDTVLGKHHPDTKVTVRDLARMLDEQGKNEEAEQIRQHYQEPKEQHPSDQSLQHIVLPAHSFLKSIVYSVKTYFNVA